MHFQPCFGQNLSSQDANFRSQDPSRKTLVFLETSVVHTHQKKFAPRGIIVFFRTKLYVITIIK